MPEFDSSIEYRPVSGFPAYIIGSDGSVWSCLKKVGHGNTRGSHTVVSDEWHRINPSPLQSGHLRVLLYPGRISRLVHHLVLEAFVGPCPPGMNCRHFPDRNPANNHVGNVQWGTQTENQRDRVYHGTDCRGEKSGLAKLTEKDVHQIRLLSKTTKQEDIGKRFGVSQVAISLILRGKTWAHLKSEPSSTSV